MLFPPIISLLLWISVFWSSVKIPILGSFAELAAAIFIVPEFSILELDSANIPVPFWPFTFIVPLLVTLALSPAIPADLVPVVVIIPVVSFSAVAFVNVVPVLLFLANIPVAPWPSRPIEPLFTIFTFPCPIAPVPNSSTTSLPLVPVLYATPNSPIDSFPATSIVPLFVTFEPFTAYIPTALLLAEESLSTFIVPLLLTCP